MNGTNLDLGECKALACLADPSTTEALFATIRTPHDLPKLPERERPGLVFFESHTAAGRIADACSELGLRDLVVNPTHEAWS